MAEAGWELRVRALWAEHARAEGAVSWGTRGIPGVMGGEGSRYLRSPVRSCSAQRSRAGTSISAGRVKRSLHMSCSVRACPCAGPAPPRALADSADGIVPIPSGRDPDRLWETAQPDQRSRPGQLLWPQCHKQPQVTPGMNQQLQGAAVPCPRGAVAAAVPCERGTARLLFPVMGCRMSHKVSAAGCNREKQMEAGAVLIKLDNRNVN